MYNLFIFCYYNSKFYSNSNSLSGHAFGICTSIEYTCIPKNKIKWEFMAFISYQFSHIYGIHVQFKVEL